MWLHVNYYCWTSCVSYIRLVAARCALGLYTRSSGPFERKALSAMLFWSTGRSNGYSAHRHPFGPPVQQLNILIFSTLLIYHFPAYCVTKCVMEDVVDTASFSDRQKFFARISDTAFWDDKERVQVLIDLMRNLTAYGTCRMLNTKMCLKRSEQKKT